MQTTQKNFVKNISFLFVLVLSCSFFVSAVNESCTISVYVATDEQELCFYDTIDSPNLLLNDSVTNFTFAILVFQEGVSDIKVGNTIINSSSCNGESFGPEGSSSFCINGGQLVENENLFEIEVFGTTYYFTTFLDSIAPVITVPADIIIDATSADGAVVYYNVSSDGGEIVSCTHASGSTFDDGTTTIVTCSATDAAGNIGSDNFNITVNTYVAPVVTITSGGGSGGYCSTKWTVSEWSACADGVQTRTVSYPENYCTPRADKPIESQSCTVADTDEDEIVVEDTTNPGFFSTITGNVIGTTAGRFSLALILILILLGVAYWIVAAKKRRAVKPSKKK